MPIRRWIKSLTGLFATLLAVLATNPASGDPDCRSGSRYRYRPDCDSAHHHRHDRDYRHHHDRDGHYRDDERRPAYDTSRSKPLAKPNPPFRPSAQGWMPPQ